MDKIYNKQMDLLKQRNDKKQEIKTLLKKKLLKKLDTIDTETDEKKSENSDYSLSDNEHEEIMVRKNSDKNLRSTLSMNS
jgi:hypothetical protein